jgi:hypothetical protein
MLFLQAFLQALLQLQAVASLELVAKALWGSVGCLSRGSSCLKASCSLEACTAHAKTAARER